MTKNDNNYIYFGGRADYRADLPGVNPCSYPAPNPEYNIRDGRTPYEKTLKLRGARTKKTLRVDK